MTNNNKLLSVLITIVFLTNINTYITKCADEYKGNHLDNNAEWFNNENFKNIMETVGKTVNVFKQDIEREQQFQSENYEAEILALERKRSKAFYKGDKGLAEHYLKRIEEKNDKRNRYNNFNDNILEKLSETGTSLIKGVADTYTENMRIQANGQHEIRVEAGRSHAAALGANKWKLKALDFVKTPKFPIMVTSTVLGIYTAKYGVQIAADMIKSHYKNPTIAQETSLISLKDKLYNIMLGKPILPNSTRDIILEDSLQDKFESIKRSLKILVKNDAPLKNMILYGPPGTGKTMMAQRLARSCDMEYIYFSGSSLLQLSEDKAIQKITELFEFANNSNKKLMIIIDESENLLGHRGQKDNKESQILTHILSYTGQASSNYMVIALTNMPSKLDPAFLSRCHNQIEIGLPKEQERRRIIVKYMKDYLEKPIAIKKRKQTLLLRVLNTLKKTRPNIKINVSKNIFNKDLIDHMVQETKGFSGRDIANMFLNIQSDVLATLDLKLKSKHIEDNLISAKLSHQNNNQQFKDKIYI